jgi:HTH-type transcriptional regulator/antitoxin HigA
VWLGGRFNTRAPQQDEHAQLHCRWVRQRLRRKRRLHARVGAIALHQFAEKALIVRQRHRAECRQELALARRADDERDVLVTLIEAYENKHYAFGPADPVDAIRFRMEQQGLTPRDLEPFIGPSGRVSEVLNRKRPLSLRMVKQLHDGLKIPYESLLAGVS